MASTFCEEYSHYLNEIKNRIFRSELKFRQLRLQLEHDYKEGIITKKQYDKISSLRLCDVSDDAVEQRYLVSREEALFVLEHAVFFDNGDLSVELLKEEFTDKEELYNKIFESIRIHGLLESLSIEERKCFVIEYINREFKIKFEEMDRNIEEAELAGKNQIYIDKLIKEKDTITKQKEALLLKVSFANDHDLVRMVDLIFNVNYCFYEWYRRMSLQDEYEKGFIYDEHLKATIDLDKNNSQMRHFVESTECSAKKMQRYALDLAHFNLDVLDFDISEFKPKKGLFKKGRNNKTVLHDLFVKLSHFNGSLEYLMDFSSSEKFDIDEVFEAYFTEMYSKEAKYVDVEQFYRDYIKNVLEFFKTQIEFYTKFQETNVRELKDSSKKVSEISQRAVEQARTQKNIYDILAEDKTLVIEGLSEKECRRIYADMKEYLIIFVAEYHKKIAEMADKKLS